MRTEQEVQNGSKPKRRFNIADDAVPKTERRRRRNPTDCCLLSKQALSSLNWFVHIFRLYLRRVSQRLISPWWNRHIWMQGNGIDTRTPRCTAIIRAGLITSSHAVATLLQNRNTSDEKKMMSTYKKKKKCRNRCPWHIDNSYFYTDAELLWRLNNRALAESWRDACCLRVRRSCLLQSHH